MRDRFDRVQIDTDDERSLGHVFLSYLEPTSGGCTQVDTAFRLAEEIVFSIQVDKLADGRSAWLHFHSCT